MAYNVIFEPYPMIDVVCRAGAISQAAGSAYIEMANTKIICAV